MCEDPHGPGGDPDRAGTANWAASQIPLDDNGQHTRRPRYGADGHNVRPRRSGPTGRPRGPWIGYVLGAVAWLLACLASGDDARDDRAQGRRGPVYRLFTSDGARTLYRDGPAAWYRWVFVDLDRHQPSCKWAAFLRLVTGRRRLV